MDMACVACQRRGAECVGQEYLTDREDDMAMAARIVRLETLMGNLIDKIIPDEMDEDGQNDEPQRDDEFARRSEPLLKGTKPLTVRPPLLVKGEASRLCSTASGFYFVTTGMLCIGRFSQSSSSADLFMLKSSPAVDPQSTRLSQSAIVDHQPISTSRTTGTARSGEDCSRHFRPSKMPRF